MKEPLITVIVPFYKVEDYIDRCIRSILNQTYKNLEIILVDDGSPDNCGNIIDRYAQIDPRIIALHKENGGLSDARNYATQLARGEFLSYIDGDDWVSPYYIENLYSAIIKDNADLAVSGFQMVYEDKPNDNQPDNVLRDYMQVGMEECLRSMFYQRGIETSAASKLYKRDMFHMLVYPKGKLYEDIPVTYAVIKHAKKIAIIKNEDYYYFQRATSIQNTSFVPQKLEAIEHMKDVVNDIENSYQQLISAAHCRYFSCVCNILFQICDMKYEAEKKLLWNEVKHYRGEVLVDREASLKSRMAAALSFLGFGVMRHSYYFLKRR